MRCVCECVCVHVRVCMHVSMRSRDLVYCTSTHLFHQPLSSVSPVNNS